MVKVIGSNFENLGTYDIDDLPSLWMRMTRLCSRFPELTPTSCYVVPVDNACDVAPLLDVIQ